MTHALNLVFHRLVAPTASLGDLYTLHIDYFTELLCLMNSMLVGAKFNSTVRLYFDDNYRETLNRVVPLLANSRFERVVAVHTDSLEREEHCSIEDLQRLRASGFRVASHGVSHAALAVYGAAGLQPTPLGGTYRNMPAGRSQVLAAQEVMYQFVESKRLLAPFGPSEFVLPYGLYNEQTALLNAASARYAHLTTCDAYLDSGECLRPRCLITSDRTVIETVNMLAHLAPRERRS